jgi:hypothetical protein
MKTPAFSMAISSPHKTSEAQWTNRRCPHYRLERRRVAIKRLPGWARNHAASRKSQFRADRRHEGKRGA